MVRTTRRSMVKLASELNYQKYRPYVVLRNYDRERHNTSEHIGHARRRHTRARRQYDRALCAEHIGTPDDRHADWLTEEAFTITSMSSNGQIIRQPVNDLPAHILRLWLRSEI